MKFLIFRGHKPPKKPKTVRKNTDGRFLCFLIKPHHISTDVEPTAFLSKPT